MSDTLVENEQDQVTDEAPETDAEGEGENKNKKERAKTTYFDPTAVDALDELPENPKITRSGGGREQVYAKLLNAIAEQGVDGKWRPLARFGTSSGAKTVANMMNRQVEGKIGDGPGLVKETQLKEIPEFEGVRWTFDSRRVPNEADPAKIESILYAKLVEVDE